MIKSYHARCPVNILANGQTQASFRLGPMMCDNSQASIIHLSLFLHMCSCCHGTGVLSTFGASSFTQLFLRDPVEFEMGSRGDSNCDCSSLLRFEAGNFTYDPLISYSNCVSGFQATAYFFCFFSLFILLKALLSRVWSLCLATIFLPELVSMHALIG